MMRKLIMAGVCLGLGMSVASTQQYVFVDKWGSRGPGNGDFEEPHGVAVDASGNVYVADSGNQRIQKFTSSGVFLDKWGSFGPGNVQFHYPEGVGVDAAGNVYVADSGNSRIQKFTSTGSFVTAWGSTGGGAGQLDYPVDVAVDEAGNVYVADAGAECILKFTGGGAFLDKWGSPGVGAGQFNEPYGVATDRIGNVYVADSLNRRIQRFTSDGLFVTKWGSYGAGEGEFDFPTGVAADAAGVVHVVDCNHNRIQAFTSTGSFVTKWGATGMGDGQFSNPWGVAVDKAGTVYVADQGNDRIQKFAPVRRLSWVETSGYQSDGVEPDQGDHDTQVFTFSVKFTDLNGDPPSKAKCRVHGRTCSGWTQVKSATMSHVAGSLATGAIYSWDTKLPNYPLLYRFDFKDVTGTPVNGVPATYREGPLINGPPLLCWAQGSDFGDDGVHPDSVGKCDPVTFRVQYRDGASDPPTTRVVRIRRNGQFFKKAKMIKVSGGDLRVGKDYQATLVLGEVGSYEYRFDFADASGAATGTPTGWTSGPSIILPSLAWVGTNGYRGDGVKPDRGDANSQAFAFKVRYTDPCGDAPGKAQCRIYKRLGPKWKLHKDLALAKKPGNIATGAIYQGSTTLPNYTYRYKFLFVDASGSKVAGPPASYRLGPKINAGPILFWTGEAGHETDGVAPDSGPADTAFAFRVLYQDSAGNRPTQRQLLIRRGEEMLEPTHLVRERGGSFRNGMIYSASVSLSSGTYQYKFRFADATGDATGAPANFQSGPTITIRGSSSTINALAVAPTPAGAQVTFTLSSSASVSARILNIAGRPVKTICTARDCEAGANTLLWNATSNQGTTVPNGTYLVEVTARGGGGGEARALTRVSIQR